MPNPKPDDLIVEHIDLDDAPDIFKILDLSKSEPEPDTSRLNEAEAARLLAISQQVTRDMTTELCDNLSRELARAAESYITLLELLADSGALNGDLADRVIEARDLEGNS